MLGYRHNHTAGTLRRANGLSALDRPDLRGRLEPVLLRDPPRRRGGRARARRRHVRGQLRRGPGARARADRGRARAPRRRPDHRADRAPTTPTCCATSPTGVGARVRRPPAARRSTPTACSATTAAAPSAAVAHLIAHGHRRIAFIGHPPIVYTAAERFAGYRAALRRAGIAEELVRYPRPATSASTAATELLSGPDAPTALFSAART